MPLFRGMKPFRPEAIPLKFGNYMKSSLLPTVPKIWGHVRLAQPPSPGGWGMLGNDQAGCCVMSGGSHEHQTWAWATGRPIPRFTDQSVLADYSKCLVSQGGRPFDPNDPDTDTGLDPVAAAHWRQTVGITDADGIVHKVGPVVQLTSIAQMEMAGYLFGCVGMCWNLPGSADAQFEAHHIWDDLSSPPEGGHYTELAGRNSKGNLIFITWGAAQAATDAYVEQNMSGATCYLSEEYLLATGKSPEGINWAQLASDQQQNS